MNNRELLASELADQRLVEFFYLDVPTEEALERMDSLSLELCGDQCDVPFNAQVKGYSGALDSDGDLWILKPSASAAETLYHRECALAFLLDHWMGTLAAPTTVFAIGGATYRASKVIRNSIQISSYNYMESPFIGWLRSDLVNRWLYFDEDRNPNNYLVIRNAADRPFVVAIDFDKADFDSEGMKIEGMDDRFGWIRGEKTRFLTLLRPDNFMGVPIEAFEPKLASMMGIPADALRRIAFRLVDGYCDSPKDVAERLAANIERRRAYIDSYFRRMFKLESATENVSNSDDYSMFGPSFLSSYGKKH